MMADDADERWRGLVEGTTFELRTHVSVIKGYSQLLKMYIDQLKQEGIEPPVIAFGKITLEVAVRNVLKATEHLELLESQLRAELHKSHGDTEGRNNDTER
jgi:hypothetical protein